MPYSVIRVPEQDCWKVFNTETGRVHAKCTTLEKAKKQYYMLVGIDSPCRRLRKDDCLESEKCDWTVGRGCDLRKSLRGPEPDLPWKRRSPRAPMRKSPSRKSPVRVKKEPSVKKESSREVEQLERLFNRIPKLESRTDIDELERLFKTIPKLSSPKKSPIRSPKKSSKKSISCSRLRKAECIASPGCIWTVGKGCGPKRILNKSP